MPKRRDITGLRFGQLLVLSELGGSVKRAPRVRCQCTCGRTADLVKRYLVSGRTISCGCVRSANRFLGRRKHGRSYTVEYTIWQGIKDRCLNHRNGSYKHYGARGITICDRWRDSFENFFADMGPRPSGVVLKRGYSIDRRDNDGPYDPDNCRWATQREQMNNCSQTRHLTYLGETMSAEEWAKRVGIPKRSILQRINDQHWSIERALTTPLSAKHHRIQSTL